MAVGAAEYAYGSVAGSENTDVALVAYGCCAVLVLTSDSLGACYHLKYDENRGPMAVVGASGGGKTADFGLDLVDGNLAAGTSWLLVIAVLRCPGN